VLVDGRRELHLALAQRLGADRLEHLTAQLGVRRDLEAQRRLAGLRV
jgi:hypothetical protein